MSWCKSPDVGLPDPDKVFYLELSATAAEQRSVYGEERYETVAFQKQVEQQFDKLRGKEWLTLDAARDIDSLHAEILDETLRVIDASADQPIGKLWTNGNAD